MHDPPTHLHHDSITRTIDSWCGLQKKKQHRTFAIALAIPYLTFKKYIINIGISEVVKYL